MESTMKGGTKEEITETKILGKEQGTHPFPDLQIPF